MLRGKQMEQHVSIKLSHAQRKAVAEIAPTLAGHRLQRGRVEADHGRGSDRDPKGKHTLFRLIQLQPVV